VIETSYSELRRRLAHYLDEIVDDREEVVVRRRGGRDVVLVDAAEYASMKETLHVLTPIENARRLLEAFEQSDRGEGVEASVEELRTWVETGQPPERLAGVLRHRADRAGG
jgi:antitoxin YefM